MNSSYKMRRLCIYIIASYHCFASCNSKRKEIDTNEFNEIKRDAKHKKQQDELKNETKPEADHKKQNDELKNETKLETEHTKQNDELKNQIKLEAEHKKQQDELENEIHRLKETDSQKTEHIKELETKIKNLEILRLKENLKIEKLENEGVKIQSNVKYYAGGNFSLISSAKRLIFLNKNEHTDLNDFTEWNRSLQNQGLVLQKLKHLEMSTIDFHSFQFEQDEDCVLILTTLNNASLPPLTDSQPTLINNIEFRKVFNTNNSEVILAINVLPHFLPNDTITNALRSEKKFIPEKSYRNDFFFRQKIEIIKILADLQEDFQTKTGTLGNGITYEIGRQLGTGGQGRVFFVYFYLKGLVLPLAFKEIKANLKNKDMKLMNEIVSDDGMNRHPNAMQFYGTYITGKGKIFLAYEILDGTWYDKKEVLSTNRQTENILNIISAVRALHRKGRTHWDLHTQNLFYSGTYSKIGDFGESISIEDTKLDSADHFEDIRRLAMSILMFRAHICAWCSPTGEVEKNWIESMESRYPDFKKIPSEELQLLLDMSNKIPSKRPNIEEVADRYKALYPVEAFGRL